MLLKKEKFRFQREIFRFHTDTKVGPWFRFPVKNVRLKDQSNYMFKLNHLIPLGQNSKRFTKKNQTVIGKYKMQQCAECNKVLLVTPLLYCFIMHTMFHGRPAGRPACSGPGTVAPWLRRCGLVIDFTLFQIFSQCDI